MFAFTAYGVTGENTTDTAGDSQLNPVIVDAFMVHQDAHA
jgi:hypothetical protein